MLETQSCGQAWAFMAFVMKRRLELLTREEEALREVVFKFKTTSGIAKTPSLSLE